VATPFQIVPPRIALPKKLPTDLPSALKYIKNLTEVLQAQNNLIADAINGLAGAGLLANRPSPTPASPLQPGSTFYDGSHFYVWDGSAWQTVV
jgi:hypothetical protein